MPAQTYRKKPVTVEAIQWNGGYTSDETGTLGVRGQLIEAWFEEHGQQFVMDTRGRGSILIKTLEGTMIASPGDFIIRGLQGEFYPCKPDIFAATYELADPPKPKYEVVGPAGRRTKSGASYVINVKVGDLVRSRYSNRSTGTVWRVESIWTRPSGLPVLRTRSLSSNRRNEQWATDVDIVREVQG